MTDGLNKVMLIGNLGADPELKVTSGGQAILKLRIATAESYVDKQTNERKERTEWHSVTLWGKRAEGLARILKKGSRIFVEGSLRTSSYDKDGEKRYRTEINAINVILAGGGERQGPAQQSAEFAGAPQRSRAATSRSDFGDAYEADGFGDTEIPF